MNSRLGMIATSLAFVCFWSFLGCGGTDGPTTVAVSGTVTLNGQPLTAGRVRFMPDAPDGQMAFGDIDSSGNYVLSTKNPGDGIIPGSYKVAINPPPPGENVTDLDAKTAPPETKIPEQYLDHEKSGLAYTINEAQTIAIELK
ncbi:MAG: hypothetical protein WEB58_07530 [Planctomycetaceae bacterium]